MDILTVAVYVLPAAFYLLAWWMARRSARASTSVVSALPGFGDEPLAAGPAALRESTGAASRGTPGSGWLIAALVTHAGSVAIAVGAGPGTGLRFGFAPALSAILWVGAALLWVESIRMRVAALQMVVMPVAAIATLLPIFFPGVELGPLGARPLVLPHLLVGTLAYGVLLLASLHAGLMMAAERALHGVAGSEHSMFARWFEELPPLLALERMLFRFIWLGFGLLTLTAISGIVFSEEVFGRPLRFDHKTVFSLMAWGMFGLLLIGRARWGWRGRTALRLTISGFVVLLLAYVGTRFVLEVVLQRS